MGCHGWRDPGWIQSNFDALAAEQKQPWSPGPEYCHSVPLQGRSRRSADMTVCSSYCLTLSRSDQSVSLRSQDEVGNPQSEVGRSGGRNLEGCINSEE